MELEPNPVEDADDVGGAERGRPLREYLVSGLLGAVADRETLPEGELPNEPLEAEALLRDALRERATDLHLDSPLRGLESSDHPTMKRSPAARQAAACQAGASGRRGARAAPWGSLDGLGPIW